MGRGRENTGFVCEYCGAEVEPVSNGSYRNHCPYCLYSKHVDESPGDRQSSCGGLMKPVELAYHRKKGYQVIHRCLRCGETRANMLARDTIQPDDVDAIAGINMCCGKQHRTPGSTEDGG